MESVRLTLWPGRPRSDNLEMHRERTGESETEWPAGEGTATPGISAHHLVVHRDGKMDLRNLLAASMLPATTARIG